MDENKYNEALKIKRNIHNLEKLLDFLNKPKNNEYLANYYPILGELMINVLQDVYGFDKSLTRDIEFRISELKEEFDNL